MLADSMLAVQKGMPRQGGGSILFFIHILRRSGKKIIIISEQ